MAVSITIPTPPGAGQPAIIKVGKHGREFESAAHASDWSDRVLDPERDIAIAIAIRLAVARPGTRGRTLVIDMAATNNIMRIV